MKILNWVLIVGFLFLDWLLFHDIFKAGETYTVTEILTGILSIGVFVVAIKEIFTPGNQVMPVEKKDTTQI